MVQWRAMISGTLGATASMFAKLGLSSSSDSPISKLTYELCIQHISAEDSFCNIITLFVRALCLLLMVAVNALMMSSFLEGMQESGSVSASALSTAANFSVSAIYGLLLFDESISGMWCIGFSTIMVGVWMLSSVKVKQD
mmetsp:Transcript_1827/g.2714  ORF Transcript_1827/g.2714 Transcript_1827/m.2714 type:complete len:140 (-) Transcript_1827:548-967(-)